MKITGNMFSNKPLDGQHAIITGGSRGIGASIAEYLARLGANISLTGRTEKTLVKQKKALEKNYGIKVHTAIGDMGSELDVKKCFEDIKSSMGLTQILINNAGIGKSAPFHRLDSSLWNEVIGLNLTGTFLCTQQVFSDMREAGYGRIVNISSTVGLRGYPYIAAYCASKHALEGLMKSLAMEGENKGIQVFTVTPGMFMKTPMSEQNYEDEYKKKWIDPIKLTPAFLKLASASFNFPRSFNMFPRW